MIKFILFAVMLDGSGWAPIAEVKHKEDCDMLAYQMSTHPDNAGQVEFFCTEKTRV